VSSAPTPQPRRNNAIWWVLGIIGGGIVLVVVAGLLFAGYFIRHVSVNDSGKKVEIETPAGTIRVSTDQSHPTGLPIYPGATVAKSEGATVDFSAQNGAAMGVATETYTTSDDIDKVAAWYAEKLGPKYRRESDAEGNLHDRGSHGSKADIVFENKTGEGTRVVTLTKQYRSVQITLVRAGKKEIQ
jgi:hypothetical protein